LDASLLAKNSVAFIGEQLQRARFAAPTPVVLLASAPAQMDRYRGSGIGGIAPQVLLYRSATDTAACVAQLKALFAQHRQTGQLQLLAAALDGAAHGLALIDARAADLPIVYVNAEFCALSGYSAAEVVGRGSGFLCGPETDPATEQSFQAALHAGQDYAGELLNYRKDGKPFWNALSVRVLRDANGSVQYFAATCREVTDERRVRERLRASEARLELAMSASELAMWDWNIESGDIYYNDQWQGLLEAPTEELLLRQTLVERLVLPPDDSSVMTELQRHVAGQAPRFEREFDLKLHSGKAKTVVARASVVQRNAEGRALRVIGVWRDVTARKNNLRAIEENHKRWERAVAGTSDGLFDWDLASGYVWYAPRFREQLGYDEQQFGNTFTAFQNMLHDQERIAVLAKIRGHLEQRSALDLNCRLRCGNGEYRWFRLRGSAERDAAGRPRRLSGSIRDISSLLDAEQALHRSESFYGTILDALPLSVAYLDLEQRIVYANKASALLTGVDLKSLLNKPLAEVLVPELYSQLALPLAQALRAQTTECQVHAQDRAGQPLDVDVSCVPHRDQHGKVQGCFALARNVTQRLRLEAELRQSQKMEAIGRLTGGVAHDFNNLLSVTIGNAQLLTRTLKDSPRLHKQAEAILRAAMRGAELTRRLLTFARQQQSQAQIVDLNDTVRGMVELLRRTLPTDIELRLQLDDAARAGHLDPGQFENALLNLAINARDAMPQGGVLTLLSCNESIGQSGDLPAGEYVSVTVADTGSGMSTQVLQRACEPFFTTKESGKGSGLGLAMVQSFVKSCGGQLVLRSESGRGTGVTMYFPVARQQAAPVAKVETVALDLPRGSETVLVAEDNDDVRVTAADMLGNLGYCVLTAASGPEALALLERQPQIALVFSDAMLPGGVTAAALLRRVRERHPRTRVLLTSGFSDTVVTHRSMLDGSVDLLAKPYQMSDLARRVRAVLDGNEEKVRVQA
jgi:PAS domain S-box-containing protein